MYHHEPTRIVDYDEIRYGQGWGDRKQGKKSPSRIQKYELIKGNCKAQGVLWEDPIFPANDGSVSPRGNISKRIDWLRPKDLCKDPQMYVEGVKTSDVNQGELGRSWFLAAIGSLCATNNEGLFHQVVPRDNTFGRDYAGVFHFKFWENGVWEDVVVDDRLPTIRGQLAFVHSTALNEFWPALLEKAYAKLHGSYEALERGSTARAMEDFTGGITDIIDLRRNVFKDLFRDMKVAFIGNSLMCCSFGDKDGREGRQSNGLVVNHGYSITSVKQVIVQGRAVNLIRLRNAWGRTEWNGAWSDGSREWENVPTADRESLGLIFVNDGEFWMSFDDFLANFSRLEICRKDGGGDQKPGEDQGKTTALRGSWIKYVNAGGCFESNRGSTFWANPQYDLQIGTPDKNDTTATVTVTLRQKERRKHNDKFDKKLLAIRYYIFKNDDGKVRPRGKRFFGKGEPVERNSNPNIEQEVVGCHRLETGRYIIVPTTYEPNEEGDFELRIRSENPAPVAELDDETIFSKKEEDRDLHLLKMIEELPIDPVSKDLFEKAAGDDGEVDAYELRTVIDSHFRSEFKMAGLSLETARSMVALMDSDHSGTLDYKEFSRLWAELKRWKEKFLEHDSSNTGSLMAMDMRAALRAADLYVSNHTLKCIVMRYTDPKGYIQFDEFIQCVVRLRTMFKAFVPELSKQVATFTLDKVIQYTMYS